MTALILAPLKYRKVPSHVEPKSMTLVEDISRLTVGASVLKVLPLIVVNIVFEITKLDVELQA